MVDGCEEIKRVVVDLKSAFAAHIGAHIDTAVRDGDDEAAAILNKAKADLAAQGRRLTERRARGG